MTLVRYITHAEVVVDPAVPVPEWGLSERGRARVHAMLAQPWVDDVGRIVSSGETKALETADILARHLGLPVEQRDDTGEIDRSVPGFLPPDEFEVVADACFTRPPPVPGGGSPRPRPSAASCGRSPNCSARPAPTPPSSGTVASARSGTATSRGCRSSGDGTNRARATTSPSSTAHPSTTGAASTTSSSQAARDRAQPGGWSLS